MSRQPGCYHPAGGLCTRPGGVTLPALPRPAVLLAGAPPPPARPENAERIEMRVRGARRRGKPPRRGQPIRGAAAGRDLLQSAGAVPRLHHPPTLLSRRALRCAAPHTTALPGEPPATVASFEATQEEPFRSILANITRQPLAWIDVAAFEAPRQRGPAVTVGTAQQPAATPGAAAEGAARAPAPAPEQGQGQGQGAPAGWGTDPQLRASVLLAPQPQPPAQAPAPAQRRRRLQQKQGHQRHEPGVLLLVSDVYSPDAQLPVVGARTVAATTDGTLAAQLNSIGLELVPDSGAWVSQHGCVRGCRCPTRVRAWVPAPRACGGVFDVRAGGGDAGGWVVRRRARRRAGRAPPARPPARCRAGAPSPAAPSARLHAARRRPAQCA